MIMDHAKITRLLEELKGISPNNDTLLLSLLNSFKWELEKHFFTEEKAIFVFYQPESQEEQEATREILEQHDKIFKELTKVEERIREKKLVDIQVFKRILLKHKNHEEEVFYPRLDEQLDEKTKEMIFQRLTNPI
ncbi:MAG: hemerythrin domain-containing protein [Candidatus Hodarchaeota archaeon]